MKVDLIPTVYDRLNELHVPRTKESRRLVGKFLRTEGSVLVVIDRETFKDMSLFVPTKNKQEK